MTITVVRIKRWPQVCVRCGASRDLDETGGVTNGRPLSTPRNGLNEQAWMVQASAAKARQGGNLSLDCAPVAKGWPSAVIPDNGVAEGLCQVSFRYALRGCFRRCARNSSAGHAPQCHVRDLAATPPMASIGVSAHKPVSQASGRLRRSTTGIGQGRRFDRRLAG